ncbi:MAG TPA: AAA family ATPase [Mycobacteriales bacterium]|nr:AAA family ATPase [Mycobacteriales bacterium]
MSQSPGRVVMLVGTSSAGKSTTAAALQSCFDEHHLLVGFDVFLRMIDPRWGGHGPYTQQGFRYDPSTVDGSGALVSTISCGPVGERILNGTHRAVAALARAGNDVIVDEMLLDENVLADWRAALDGLCVYVVQVQAPVEVMVVRERERGQAAGLARGHLPANTLASYDIAVDTSLKTPAECAADIAAAIAASRRPDNPFTR